MRMSIVDERGDKLNRSVLLQAGAAGVPLSGGSIALLRTMRIDLLTSGSCRHLCDRSKLRRRFALRPEAEYYSEVERYSQ
jgi:hypothetical protein